MFRNERELSSNSEVSTGRERLSVPRPLKKLIVDAYKSKNKSIGDDVEEIDLQSLGPEAEELIVHTLTGETMKEFGRVIYVSDGKKIVIDDEPQPGNETNVALLVSPLPGKKLLGISRKKGERYFVGTMHSHPVDLPFSSLDLVTLIAKDNPYKSLTSIVATPKRTMVCFRGSRSPSLSTADVVQKSKEWSMALNERINKHRQPTSASGEFLDLSNRVQTAMLRDISIRYDLRVYSGERGSSVVKRVKFLTS